MDGGGRLLLLAVALAALAFVVEARTKESARPLNRFIRHYEDVEYDESQLMWNHHRFRRSFNGPREVPLKFTAFGRTFDLRLTPEKSLFHDNFTLIVDGKTKTRHGHITNIYAGYDSNDPTSRVHGNLVEGVFDGSIHSDGEVYQVEPASRYAEDLNSSHSAHSIIYRHSDLDTSSVTGASCGATNQALQSRLIELQRSAVRQGVEGEREDGRRLFKRQQRDTTRIRCWLRIIADNKFVLAHTSGSRTQREAQAMALISRYVSDASTYYQRTDFDGDGLQDNIHFGIDTLFIELDAPTSGDFTATNIGVELFLQRHSEADFSDFCLSYRFTHRDFDNGVLGLAYVAAQPPSGLIGGICEDFTTFTGNVRRTLNTGIVTTLNFNRVVPTAVTSITFAHEAGHNFGSQHDPDSNPACVPATNGQFIMYAFANDGSEFNNERFSPCSIEMMNNVIAVNGQGPQPRGCFALATGECGNNVIDPGEECDCGPQGDAATGNCPTDMCCNATSCMSRNDVDCSPGEGLNACCSSSCSFIPASDNMVCREDTICASQQMCNGTIAVCPPVVPKTPPVDPGYIVCNNDSQLLCNNDTGECDATICAALNMGSGPLMNCECSLQTEACHVCCKLDNGSCISTIALASENSTMLPNGMGAIRPVGFPCQQFTGYCDFFDNCAMIDSDGALRRLANIFSQFFGPAIEWIRDMWWAVLLIAVGVLVIMFVIVLVFHLILPRPKHAKHRAERRRTLRQRKQAQPQQGYPMESTPYTSQYHPY